MGVLCITFGYDGLGSTRILTNVSGTVQNAYGYEAFGEVDYQLGTVENKYLFTGEQYDNNVGFYYLRARFYNPSVGRFHSLDTYAGRDFEPATLHKYLYTGNNPINFIDYSGNNFNTISLSIAQNVGARIATYSLAFPKSFALVRIAASVATPFEIAALNPVTLGLLTGGALSYQGIKSLDKARELAQSSFWLNRINSGRQFESFVGELIQKTATNTRAIINGGIASGRPKGSAIPDWFYAKGILEAKLTGAAVKKNQIKQFAEYLGDEGNLTYIFKIKPTAAKVQQMENWISETGKKINLNIAYIFEQ
ncbi:MAG: RHS repeat-associated core domain-containing protein [Marinicellaceae bacterium]